MSNLLGNPFRPYVKNQVETRQKILSRNSKVSQDSFLKYSATKTPWIRLASSIDLDNGGSSLAKNFLLYGGSISLGKSPEKGLNTNNQLYKGVYGWGNLKERGYVPFPGIIGAEVTYLNDGAFAETTVTMKCYSKKQLEFLDKLYLRPGYSLLLEFGWTVYLDNTGNAQRFTKFETTPFSQFINGTADQYGIYDTIQNERLKYSGNYDAVIGVVNNFNWTFNPDGTYDCITRLVGIGDMIESLKMNISPVDFNYVVPEGSTIVGIGDNQLGVRSTDYDIGYIKPQPSESEPKEPDVTKTRLAEILRDSKIFKTPIEKSDGNVDIINDILVIPGVVGENELVGLEQVYITFGTLLKIIQDEFLLYNDGTPITKFAVNFDDIDNDENVIFTFPGNFSSRPDICLIPIDKPTFPEGNNELDYFDIFYEDSTNDKELNIYNVLKSKGRKFKFSEYLGKLCNIYLNRDYLIKTLDDLTTSSTDNSVSILSYLKEILIGITKSLGGINKISIRVNSDEGTLSFYEGIPQNYTPPRSDFTKINMYGVNSQEGSFVKSIQLNADISKDFASLIAIGAQANGNELNGDSTAFSVYNKGLTDRVIKSRRSKNSEEDKIPQVKKIFDKELKDYLLLCTNTQGYKRKRPVASLTYGREVLYWSNKNLTTLNSLHTQWARLMFGELNRLRKTKGSFFLPFSLQLELDGISGIRLYDKFLIDDKVLPPSYDKDNMDIIVGSVNHSISNQGWSTKLDTITSPRF